MWPKSFIFLHILKSIVYSKGFQLYWFRDEGRGTGMDTVDLGAGVSPEAAVVTSRPIMFQPRMKTFQELLRRTQKLSKPRVQASMTSSTAIFWYCSCWFVAFVMTILCFTSVIKWWQCLHLENSKPGVLLSASSLATDPCCMVCRWVLFTSMLCDLDCGAAFSSLGWQCPHARSQCGGRTDLR